MFELNLIKDKAKARQRRRVIFLSIVSIALLSGLCVIAVGSLYWAENTQLQKREKSIADISNTIKAMQEQFNREDPIVRNRRNAMINAWTEDFEVIQNRPRFTPVLSDLAQHHPRNGDFWYNEIRIRPIRGATTTGGTPDPNAVAKSLMGSRQLEGGGYIEIEQSDVMTDNELADMTQRMNDMVDLVGQPTFTIDEQQKSEGASADTGRYVRFTVRAASTTFIGATGTARP